MCFPVGDPYIQTSCSLSGRVEYTPPWLGLEVTDLWFQMENYSNDYCTIFLIYIFSENISTIYRCIHWPVVQKWTHKFVSYITKQETFQWNSSTAHPDGSHVGWGINSLLLESLRYLFYGCLILTIRHGLHQYWTFNYKLYLREIKWQLVLWL